MDFVAPGREGNEAVRSGQRGPDEVLIADRDVEDGATARNVKPPKYPVSQKQKKQKEASNTCSR